MYAFIRDIVSVLLFLESFTLALTLPSLQDITSTEPLPPRINNTFPSPALLTPLSLALTSNLSRDADNSAPVCDGNLLGFDMNRYSCLQAWNSIPISRETRSFGAKSVRTFEVPLPRRFSGREFCRLLSAVARPCFVVKIHCHGLTLTRMKRMGPASSTSFTRMVSYRI